MSLPRFLDRVVDATAPLLGGLDRDAVRGKLENTAVTLVGGERVASGASRDGFLLAANLLARLYPRIHVDGPTELVAAAAETIIAINPLAEIGGDEATTATLTYETAVAGDDVVSVCARGWNVYVDQDPAGEDGRAPSSALLAAALGAGELFRIVFAAELGDRGRRGRQPGAWNIVTLADPVFDLPVPETIDVGRIRLVGAGAIGQAAAHALGVSGAQGTMVVVDPEAVALSNLQRYILTGDGDVDAVKVELLKPRLEGSALEVESVESEWHAGLVDDQLPTLVALDSPEARIGVQASLPGPIYNAWTQPADVGWSRHERFGDEPCLACLYWPDHEIPSRHEQIATVFGQHPLRVLAYLVHRGIPIGQPLPPGAIPSLPDLPTPPEAAAWLTTPLVDDIAATAGIDVAGLAGWRDRPLADVYQDGICGGALLHLNVGEAPHEVLVPLAHQSVFAGVMLATQLLVANVSELKAVRAAATEGRYDVLTGLPQVLARPRQQTQGCLCTDVVFRAVYGDRFGKKTLRRSPAAEADEA